MEYNEIRLYPLAFLNPSLTINTVKTISYKQIFDYYRYGRLLFSFWA